MGLGCLIGMLVQLALGVPVGLSLGVSGFAGFYLILGWDGALSQIQNLPYAISAQYVFALIPLFVLMGNLAVTGGIAKDLYDAADKWIGHRPGGLYLTTIFGSTGFAAVCGSTVVNSTVFTRIALPEMMRLGYSKSMAGACVASVGTMSAMIPPSLAMVIYGIICEVSIGKLFVAGIIPGLLMMLVYVLLVRVMVQLRPELAPTREKKAEWRDRIVALGTAWTVVFVFGLIMGGIYLGVFSPSQAGAAGAAATLVLALARRRLTIRNLWQDLEGAAVVTAMLFVIIIGGMLFSRMLLLSGFITGLVDLVSAFSLNPLVIVLLFTGMYILLGCMMDAVSMMVVTLPFVFPVASAVGINPIWFGIIVVQLVEIGMVTPPIGLNLFATVSAAQGNVSMTDLVRGITPFVLASFAVLAMLIAFPQIVLWLPDRMMGS